MENILIHQDSELKSNGLKDWTLKLERLKANAQEDGVLSDGDEPYFIAVGFRSRLDTPGSTQTFVNDFNDADWVDGIDDGDSRDILSSMGTLNFSNVETLSAGDVLAGKKPELVGAVVIAMEEDSAPTHIIRDIVNDLRSSLQSELSRLVEQGELDLTNPGPSITAAIERVKSAIEPDFLGKINIGLQSIGDPGDRIGIHSFLFAAVDDPLLGSFISLPGLSNATTGVLEEQRLHLEGVVRHIRLQRRFAPYLVSCRSKELQKSLALSQMLVL